LSTCAARTSHRRQVTDRQAKSPSRQDGALNHGEGQTDLCSHSHSLIDSADSPSPLLPLPSLAKELTYFIGFEGETKKKTKQNESEKYSFVTTLSIPSV